MLNVRDFYKDAVLLVTGGTGFLGQVFLQRLFSCCPDVKRVYVMIRIRCEEDSLEDRFQHLVQSKVFDKLAQKCPNFSAKLVPIYGDISKPVLGLSKEDREVIISQVTSVFHLAASSKFNSSLKLALETNLHGLKKVLELTRTIENLRSFVYTSTAYSNCNLHVVEEKVYEPSVLPQKLLTACEWMPDDVINVLEKNLKKDHPNNYTYTKSLSEHLMAEHYSSLPAVIVRPSIISAAQREPLPGWTDQLSGANKLLVSVGQGLLRVMPGDRSAVADFVPVDAVANLLLVSGCHVASLSPGRLVVCNCTCTGSRTITWGQLERLVEESYRKNPLEKVTRLPAARFTSYKLLLRLATLAEQTLPAYFLDGVGLITGRSPWRVHENKKLLETVGALSYFTSRKWNFNNSNMKLFRESLSEDEKKIFNMEVSHWPAYVESYCMGIKRYALGEELSAMPAARKALRRLLWLNRIASFLLVLMGIRVAVKRYQYARFLWRIISAIVSSIYRRLPGVTT